MKSRRIIPIIIYVAVLVLVFSWTSGLFSQKGATLSYSQVVELFCAEQVKSFVVGYGLDYNEYYRNLPYVGILKPEAYM